MPNALSGRCDVDNGGNSETGADESWEPLEMVAVKSPWTLSIANNFVGNFVEVVQGLTKASEFSRSYSKRAVSKLDVYEKAIKNDTIEVVVNFGMVE